MNVDDMRRIQQAAEKHVSESAESVKHRLYRPLYDRQLLSLTPEQVEGLKQGKTDEQAKDLDLTLESLRKRYGG